MMKRRFLLAGLLSIVAASIVYAATVSDNFDRANTNNLTGAVTWTEIESGATCLAIVSNVVSGANCGETATAYTPMATANVSVQAKFPTFTHEAGQSELGGVVCHKTANANITGYFWEYWRQDATNEHRLIERTNGSDNILGTDTTDFAADEVLLLECVGNNLTAKINGTLASFGVISDSSLVANLQVGIMIFNDGVAGAPTLDDFSATDISARRPSPPLLLQ